jgi:hypothetical protein
MKRLIFVIFYFLAAARIIMTVFWVLAPFTLLEVCGRFRDASCRKHQSDAGGGNTSETPKSFYQTTRCKNPAVSHFQLTFVMETFCAFFEVRTEFLKRI